MNPQCRLPLCEVPLSSKDPESYRLRSPDKLQVFWFFTASFRSIRTWMSNCSKLATVPPPSPHALRIRQVYAPALPHAQPDFDVDVVARSGELLRLIGAACTSGRSRRSPDQPAAGNKA